MPEKKKKNGRQNYDWDLIMNDYVCNPKMSLRKLEQKYGIPYCTIAKKSKADNWFAAKTEYREELRSRVRSKVISKDTNTLAGLVTASDYAQQAIVKALANDPEYFNKHIVSRNLNEEQATLDILNFKAMKDMMKVIKDVEDVKRSILDIKRDDQRIAAERLQLEREKFEFEKQKAEMLKPDSGMSIRIEGFEQGWAE